MKDINEEHAEMVKVLAKPDIDIFTQLVEGDCHLLHMAVGVSSDAGELLDAVKKHVIYRKPLDLENIKEELGDIEFFMEGLRAALSITREETLKHNMNKLAKRYADFKYSNEAAINRKDKV